MDKSDALGIAVSLVIAGAFIYAYERGYIKVPEFSQASTSQSSTSTTTTQTISTSSTTTSSTSNSTYGTTSGTAYIGTGSSVQINQWSTAPPSTSSSSTSSVNSSSTTTSISTSNTSSTSSTTSTSSTSSSGSSTTSTGYPSSSGGTGNVAPPTNTPCAVATQCPSFITNGSCYAVNCDCFSTYTATINNNWGQSVPIEISTEFISYCDMTQGVTWDSGYIQPGQWSMNLPYAPGNASVGGAIYVWAPGHQNPYLLNYVAVNGNNLLILREIDLAPTTTVTVTNNSPYTIILQLVSDLFEKNEVQIPPGGSGSVNVGNGWLFSVGTVDLYGNYPSSNPAPVSCFDQFILVNGQPAINFINDQDYNQCSQWQFTMTVNGQTYSGNLGEGLTNNVYTVPVSGSGGSSSSSGSSSGSGSTGSSSSGSGSSSSSGNTSSGGTSSTSSSGSSSSSSSSSSGTSNIVLPISTPTTYPTIYGGYKPKIVPY